MEDYIDKVDVMVYFHGMSNLVGEEMMISIANISGVEPDARKRPTLCLIPGARKQGSLGKVSFVGIDS
eukprot:CAMPEP_0174265888 /NCGR_PEP_ID=MMETSP0439-20130205/28329_1 /TAXON_ID=0 /ORGANISM="Stereomyxa ramosa, Strain Chinc5" /LENGTH=67 /DNA_ID=CAMNT_0015352573 /DNA_START=94 /DNA_END=294 /DNA_ORIENTATION=+